EAFRSQPIPGLTGNPPAPGPYQNGLSAGDLSDRIDDLGAFASLSPTGTGILELVRARMHANAAGTLVFTPDFTQLVSPAHDNLLYVVPGDNNTLAASDIGVTVATLTINTGPINAQPDNPPAVDEGSGPLTVNVLANDTKNAGAPAGALQVESFTQPASGGTVTRQNASDLTNGNLIFTPSSPDFNGTISFT